MELVQLGEAFFNNILGKTGLEIETFRFVTSIQEIYNVRKDLKSSVKFYTKVNFDFDGL